MLVEIIAHRLYDAVAQQKRPLHGRSAEIEVTVLEREANVFGAELLMPEAAVREAWDALPDISIVAGRFDVSLLAAQWRLYSFGLAERPA